MTLPGDTRRFHYGRWVEVVGGVWGWALGPVAVPRTILHSPALVSFIMGGVEVVGVVDPVSWVALKLGRALVSELRRELRLLQQRQSLWNGLRGWHHRRCLGRSGR